MPKALLSSIPVVLMLALFGFVTTQRERFPNPIAIHWGLTGKPDGFATLDSQLALVVGIMGFVSLIWIAIIYLKPIPQPVRVLFLAIVGMLWLLLFGIFVHTFLIQLDLADARQANIGIGFLVFTLAIPILLVPWLLARPVIEVGERFKVRYWGIPLLSVDYVSMRQVTISHVRARDFGGWGVRYANKTTAFIPSSGLALELELESGEKILVRTNQAEAFAKAIAEKKR